LRAPHTGQRTGFGAVVLWGVTDLAHPRLLGQSPASVSGVESVAFSPDGRVVASGSSDGAVRLWSVTDPARPRPVGRAVSGGAGIVYSVAFSPDGRTLASGGLDGTLRLWNIADPAHPRPLSQPLSNAGIGGVSSVAFSPKGVTLASGGLGTIRLWSPSVESAITRICAAEGGLTPRQWHQYIPDMPYQSLCAH
jgi:WD40 repeat protein